MRISDWSSDVCSFDLPYACSRIGQVVFQQFQVWLVPDTKLFDTPEIGRARAAVCAIDLIAFTQQQLRQVRAVLTGNPGNNRLFHYSILLTHAGRVLIK